MLKFIFGKPASGKSYTILNMIKELSNESKETVLIVPEQFTFETERAVLKKLGDSAALNNTVLSFSRICEEVARNIGFSALSPLTDADKIILMNRALKDSKGDLKLWSRYADSVSFAKTMLDTVGEFKINSISSEDIKIVANSTNAPTLKLKLLDIATIIENYDAIVGERFIDPADSLTKLYDTLKDFHYFSGKTVFIDSFKGFTGQQYKIIDRILSQAENVYISLTNNVNNTQEYGLFSNIRKAVLRIEKIAKAHNIKIEQPIILDTPRFNNEGLFALERLMSNESLDETDLPAVTICHAATTFDEAEFVARTIRKLVRTKGYRYRDFVIIARDADSYKEAINSACKKNNVSLFFDNRIPLSAFPLSTAIDSAINCINLSTENILRFHKTGLGTLSTDEISTLENYTYLWGIKGDMWLEEWKMDPRGLVYEAENEKSYEELEYINSLRVKAVEPLKILKNGFSGTAQNMVSAIMALLKSCSISDKLLLLCEKFKNINDNLTIDILKQSYNEYINILDSLVKCFGEKNISKTEFYDALNTAVSLLSIGVIPQMLDEVSFGSADRIRPSRPKIAFIIGANQGVFPKTISNSGILSLNERRILIEQGVEISDNAVSSAIDEEFLVYCNLCCASEKVYISYARQSISGDDREPAVFLQSILEKLCCEELCEPCKTCNTDSYPETKKAVLSDYCRNIQSNSSYAATLCKALENTGDYDLISKINSQLFSKDKSISKETSKKLFGENIFMSATRFDTFNRCRFSYFCKYGLNAKKIQPAHFDVLQRGTIVHFVLERLITEHSDNIRNLSEEMLECLCDKYLNIYLDSIIGYRSAETATLKFAVSRISRSLKDVVKHIAAELSQSDFKPIACELKIGKDCEIKSPIFKFDSGEMTIGGSIDRVDEYNGYIRIVDYKTGSKSFKLPDILFGLNLQMLIYLYALIKSGQKDNSLAAGILYQPSSRDLNGKGLAMNGLLQANLELVNAMDKSGNGEFVPKLKLNKDGSISKTASSFISACDFEDIFNYIEKLMEKTGNLISQGDFAVSPVDGRESAACKYCDFASVCGIENGEAPRVPDLSNTEVIELIKEAESNGI